MSTEARPDYLGEGPHSRACGYIKHEHGRLCNANCPTCEGKSANIFMPTPEQPFAIQGDEFFHSAMPAPEFDQDSTPIQKAIRLVYRYVKERLEKTDTHVTFSEDEVYCVMFSYVLGNWKALISTTLPDGMYYEVTHRSEGNWFYLDAYKKWDNVGYKTV